MLSRLIHTSCTEQTEQAGAALAQRMLGESLPPFVALYGDLGVGKTAFVRGFASVLCPGSPVRSPTFSLVYEHRGRVKDLFHFDMYRITDEDDLYSIGFDDYLARDGICLVEWSENIPYAIPPHHIAVTIEKNDPCDPQSRLIRIEERKEPPC
ncbi:MAG: tRNA (adenosine(37)-N6)-threonylcarbamoyltransferase complex ATPase subunit type 1 TsaE [Ruminococcaceae bacterium]|nr:tRNA (adenosine(37)-N6)-threonylcarbamoyltransferase complex ATPase subunit type 1 TsaE [Oscillospiraceae bacterium]